MESHSGDLDSLGTLRDPLEALGNLLAAAGMDVHLVVVGGVAIVMRRIRSRATADVDVIARGELDHAGNLQLIDPDPMPETFQHAVARVARDFDLRPDWVNTVVGKQWRHGKSALPPALAEETSWYVFGGLRIGIAGRRSLIALKLYAAADGAPQSVHTQDLLALAPSDEELSEGEAWTRAQDRSPGFVRMLEEVIEYVRSQR